MKKEKNFEEEITNTNVDIGTDSVYVDLGLKNHEEMETKSN